MLAIATLWNLSFSVDWESGGENTSFPTGGAFGVRKVEAFFYPPDGSFYAYPPPRNTATRRLPAGRYADVVNFTDPYYPDSYSSEVGAFSSADGVTGWRYRGIVLARGNKGGWDGAGVASPGGAVVPGGTAVLLGYCGENDPGGGRNRGIGVAVAPHPLGPFVRPTAPIASPTGLCGGTGRCDDVIMQTRPDGVHLYHSVKGNSHGGDGIRHRMTGDGGRTWTPSTMVLSTALQPGHVPAETIAGKFFPEALGGRGAMVLITDGCGANCLHAYASGTPGAMEDFVPAGRITQHPPIGTAPGDWASSDAIFPARALLPCAHDEEYHTAEPGRV